MRIRRQRQHKAPLGRQQLPTATGQCLRIARRPAGREGQAWGWRAGERRAGCDARRDPQWPAWRGGSRAAAAAAGRPSLLARLDQQLLRLQLLTVPRKLPRGSAASGDGPQRDCVYRWCVATRLSMQAHAGGRAALGSWASMRVERGCQDSSASSLTQVSRQAVHERRAQDAHSRNGLAVGFPAGRRQGTRRGARGCIATVHYTAACNGTQQAPPNQPAPHVPTPLGRPEEPAMPDGQCKDEQRAWPQRCHCSRRHPRQLQQLGGGLLRAGGEGRGAAGRSATGRTVHASSGQRRSRWRELQAPALTARYRAQPRWSPSPS